MPLTIYLDTQDYINIFNEKQDGPSHSVLKKLMLYRDRGDIVVGFSFATVLEFITKPNAENRVDRVRRGQLIKDICGSNAFPYVSDLAKGATFPNGGKWMFARGDNVLTAKKFKKEMHKALQDELSKAEGLNRSQRRQLSRKGSMIDLMRKSGLTWGRKRSDYGDFPVSDELVESRILERFMKGQCSDLEFESRLNAWISDPVEFSRIVYDYADKPNMIEFAFGSTVNEVERHVQTIQGIAEEVKNANILNLTLRSTLIDAGIDRSQARRLTKKVSVPQFDFDESIKKLESVFGAGRAEHFVHYINFLFRGSYKFKRSDVMDIFQMCYAYDCDLFRCDKAMASIFQEFEPFKGRLVGKFGDLPMAIESILNARKEGPT